MTSVSGRLMRKIKHRCESLLIVETTMTCFEVFVIQYFEIGYIWFSNLFLKDKTKLCNLKLLPSVLFALQVTLQGVNGHGGNVCGGANR